MILVDWSYMVIWLLMGLILWIFSFKNTMFRDCRNIHIKKWVGYQYMTRFVYCGWVLQDYLIVDGLILWIFSFKNTMFRDCTKYTMRMRITCMIFVDGLIDWLIDWCVWHCIVFDIIYDIGGVVIIYQMFCCKSKSHEIQNVIDTVNIVCFSFYRPCFIRITTNVYDITLIHALSINYIIVAQGHW
jgi:hypothetical protein